MKKTTVLFALFCFALATFAQKDFQLGLQVSPNLSWISPDSDGTEGEGVKFGFNYGLVGDFNIADNYSVSTGLFLASYGGKISYPDVFDVTSPPDTLGGRTTANVRLKYIEIPFTLKLKTNEIGYMKYYGQFGLGLGFNYGSNANLEFDHPNGETISQDDVDYGDEINALRVGLIIGLGAEYNLSGNTSLVMGVTFNNGFTNILSEDIYAGDGNGNGNKTGKRDSDFKAISNSILLNIGVIF